VSRQFIPRPDNKFTERYRGELNNINVEQFIKHQKSIADNIIVLDDSIDKGSLTAMKNDSLYNSEIVSTLWSPNIGYGDDSWPIDEWGYQLVRPYSTEWVESPMVESAKVLWEKCKSVIKKEFDIDDLIIHGAHMNAQMFGMESKIHNDSPDGTQAFIIIFLNDDMTAYDGGELQTYINMDPYDSSNKDFHNSETNISINPKIGRMVIADSRILHRGLSPSRFYGKTRMTIVYKMKFENQKEAWDKLEFNW
tara:strand:+ start:77 stop:829 length:753 start_codon:yes stop_codon:yes gene_type:complete